MEEDNSMPEKDMVESGSSMETMGKDDMMKKETSASFKIDLTQALSFIEANYDGYYGTRFETQGKNVNFYDASGLCMNAKGSLPCMKNILQQVQ